MQDGDNREDTQYRYPTYPQGLYHVYNDSNTWVYPIVKRDTLRTEYHELQFCADGVPGPQGEPGPPGPMVREVRTERLAGMVSQGSEASQDRRGRKANRGHEEIQDHEENWGQPDRSAREARREQLARGVIPALKESQAFKGSMVATVVMGGKGPLGHPVETVVMAGKVPRDRVGGTAGRASMLCSPRMTSILVLATGEHHHVVHVAAAPTIMLLGLHLGINKLL